MKVAIPEEFVVAVVVNTDESFLSKKFIVLPARAGEIVAVSFTC